MEKISNKKVLLFILLALLFSIGIRMIWVYQFANTDSFYWNGQLMINTNDGYFFAEGARDILNGFHQPNDLSPVHEPASLLTAWIVRILPFSFESIILFLPAVLGSFLVVPIILIGKSLKNVELGFIAALLASIAWSYYNRTMTGYYDTDMLNIVFPTFLLWSLILAITSREEKYIIFPAFFAMFYLWWYSAAYSLEVSFVGLIFVYTVIFERKNIYLYKLISVMIVSLLLIPMIYKVILIGVLLFGLRFKKDISTKEIYAIFGVCVVLFFIFGGIGPILANIKGYIIREAVTSDINSGVNLHFFSVAQTVREAGHIPFEVFANRISGQMITFFVSLIGFVWLCFRHRIMLLSLPMLGLGFLAYSGGLRFTVYAVPVLAFGVGYLIVKIGDFIENQRLRYVFMAFLTLAVLYPNIIHVKDYKVPTVFNDQEVKIIDYLKKHASREDYVISWWDYGYPLRYYGDVKTLVDGGKHSGEVNFAPSFILTKPQQVAAKMARLEVEYTEDKFKDENKTHKQKEASIAKMMKDYGYKDANDFLLSLGDIKLPKKTRDIYLYLPFRMIGIYPTVARFSDIDTMSGKMKKGSFIYRATNFKDNGKVMTFGNGMSLDKTTSIVSVGQNKFPLKSFYMVEYDQNSKLHVNRNDFHPNGYLNLVFAKSYNSIYLMDNEALNSTYMQLFLFENYDKNLYEPVVFNPYAKLYKLKN